MKFHDYYETGWSFMKTLEIGDWSMVRVFVRQGLERIE